MKETKGKTPAEIERMFRGDVEEEEDEEKEEKEEIEE